MLSVAFLSAIGIVQYKSAVGTLFTHFGSKLFMVVQTPMTLFMAAAAYVMWPDDESQFSRYAGAIAAPFVVGYGIATPWITESQSELAWGVIPALLMGPLAHMATASRKKTKKPEAL